MKYLHVTIKISQKLNLTCTEDRILERDRRE